MWQILRNLVHRRPNVTGPYNPPLTEQFDRFDIFPSDDDVAAATVTYGAELPEWDSRRLIGH